MASKLTTPLLLTALLTLSGTALAEITKQDAVDMALQAHPGQVTKAYQETKRGEKVWEVKIKGEDGRKYEIYYAVDSGEHVMTEVEDD